MLALVGSFTTAVRLYLMRRRQYDNVKLRAYFKEKHDIEVGLYSYGCFDRWRMTGPLRIGRYCSIANTVRSVPGNHSMSSLTTHPGLYERAFGIVEEDVVWPEPQVIEDDVWIGHNVVILPTCRRIGRGAVIGAGSIVTRDVEPYAVMAGNPARKLRYRFDPEMISAIEASRWWELDWAEFRQLVLDHHDLVFQPDAAGLRAWSQQR
jgi:acetyltransferase-like isoleucine patch superfamily enzyme